MDIIENSSGGGRRDSALPARFRGEGADRTIGPRADLVALSALTNITFQSKGEFLGDIAKLGALLKEVPLQLPRNGNYTLLFKEESLQIYRRDQGISDFALLDLKAVNSIQQQSSQVVIEFRLTDGARRVVLHRQPLEEKKDAKQRRDFEESRRYEDICRITSPWREERKDISSSSTASESRGGGSGER